MGGPDNLTPTLLVFRAYPHIHNIDPLAVTIIQRTAVIEKIIEKVRKIRVENQVIDIFNTKNWPIINFFYDLPFNSDILVGQKGNARYGK